MVSPVQPMQQDASQCNMQTAQPNIDGDKLMYFRELSPRQNQAIEMLLHGQSDAQVAESIGVARTTIYRWRLNHPPFRSALHASQRALQQHAADRLRSMLDTALDILQHQLADPKNALHAATILLRFARLRMEPPAPTESDLTDVLDAAFAAPADTDELE